MKIQQKQLEVWCGQYSQRWNKSAMWEFFCLVQDAWLNGYNKGATNAPYGEQVVEIEVESNQIGMSDKWGKLTEKEKFVRDMKTVYNCDIKVSDDGTSLSFQGTYKYVK